MIADGGSDENRERARTGRGLASSDRPGSPAQGARHNSDSRARHRPSRESAAHDDRHRSRDRERSGRHQSRESRDNPTSSSRHPVDKDDLIPRYRDNRARPESESRPARRSRSRERGGPGSPSSAKRHRSRSRSPVSSHRKRHKKHHSPSRRPGFPASKSDSKKRRRRSPHDWRSSSDRHHRPRFSHKSPLRLEDPLPSRQRSPSRSSTGSDIRGDHSSRDQRRQRSEALHTHPHTHPHPSSHSHSHSHSQSQYFSHPHHHPDHIPRSRSPHSKPRRPSSSHLVSSSRAAFLGDITGGGSSDSHQQPPRQGQGPPPSPKPQRDRKREDIDEHPASRSDNEDDMTSRSNHRGGYSATHPQQSHHGHDQSPPHQDSRHNSPSPSRYGPGRSGWNGHQYSSSQQQYPSQHHQGSGNYGPPNGLQGPPPSGPQGHHHSSSHSPPYAAPSGPQGSYRGSRGNGFRGGALSSRGSYRGSNSFKSAPRGGGATAGNGVAGGQPSRGINHYPHEEEASNRRSSASSAPQNEMMGEDMGIQDADGSFSNPDEVVDANQDNKPKLKPDNDDSILSSKPPPVKASGSAAAGKFSFAFKPSSKPTPTAPKPEISSKFNAAPQRRIAIQNDNNNHRSREPPPSAPTEPSSARSRRELRQSADGPKTAPRTRKVMKLVRRPKPRPMLPSDLVDSESVFFRKPGNESVVGSGTYGKVFKGLNVYTKGLVALKRIRMEGERDGFPVTAVREIKLLQSLRHTNIVNLQEVMVEKNDCFMVFEYLSHDLTGLLNHPSFSLEDSQKKHLAKQLFEGLDYLHERGVLHRDIKAANILVSSEGILKLADFGLARFYAKRHQLDYTNRVITIWYRSPELLLGETKYTAAVDIWSAACVMVEIFTRHPVFAGDGTELSQLEKIYNILGTPNLQDWPGLVDMAWFELLRPTAKRRNVFADKYEERVSRAGFDLLASMFCYDPAKRPTAAMVLQHPYFVTEEPLPRQAIELADIGGDWHEFESKALRKENERRDREAARKAATDKDREKDKDKDKDKKRAIETHDRGGTSKRVHTDQKQYGGNDEETMGSK